LVATHSMVGFRLCGRGPCQRLD